MKAHCAQEVCSIASDNLRVLVAAQGAELISLQPTYGSELLWEGDKAVWGRRAPNLFPIVGALKNDTLIHEGKKYPMTKHGFARDRRFSLVRLSRQSCTWVLKDDEETRKQYPFPFELIITYTVQVSHLVVHYHVRNPGDKPLPASLGAHPAFRWPLTSDTPREAHFIEFEQVETSPIRRLTRDGLLKAEQAPSLVGGQNGRLLALKDELFLDDAIIMNQLQSHAIRYYGPTTPVIEMAWEGFKELGIWTKPGANFICIEPWRGFASPEPFEGEFIEKPGVFKVDPGGHRSFAYAITVYE